MQSPANAEEFIVSIKALEIDFGFNVGKWTARFSISKFGKNLYHGTVLSPLDCRIEAERAAASEACRILQMVPGCFINVDRFFPKLGRFLFTYTLPSASFAGET